MPRDYIAELLEEIKTFVFQRRIRIKEPRLLLAPSQTTYIHLYDAIK